MKYVILLVALLFMVGCEESAPPKKAVPPVRVIAYHAEWCAPCKQQASGLAALVKKYKVSLKNVDADASPDELEAHSVTSLPTYDVYKNGSIFRRTNNLDDLQAAIRAAKSPKEQQRQYLESVKKRSQREAELNSIARQRDFFENHGLPINERPINWQLQH